MEKSNRKLYVAIMTMIRQGFVVASICLVSACVTTGGSSNNNQVKKVAKQSCGPGATQVPTTAVGVVANDSSSGSAASDQVNPNNCLPKCI